MSRTPVTVEEQLPLNEVARRLNVSTVTVWRLIRDKRIQPVRKIGRLVRIPASAVNAFLEAQTI